MTTRRTPGSRRANAYARLARRAPTVHPGQRYVELRFFCRRGHGEELLARAKRLTDPDFIARIQAANPEWDPAEPEFAPVRGTLPFDPDRQDAGGKFLVVCPRCGLDWQRTPATIRAALDAVWQPNDRRVYKHYL